jgi:hypothetical protein
MIDAPLRAFVRRCAGCRCEYCRLHEDDDDLFNINDPARVILRESLLFEGKFPPQD